MRVIDRSRGERGATMVEFALVMSFLLVPIVVGVAGFAVYLSNYLALTDAVSIGTRQAATGGWLPGADPCALATAAATAAYKAGSFESTTPSLTPTLTVYGPTGTVTGAANTATSCPTYAPYIVPGATVEVSISHPTQSIFSSYGSFTVKAQAETVVQGIPQ